MYPIEVLTADPYIRDALDRALGSLNEIQGEFAFRRPPTNLESEATVLRGQGHNSNDLFAWLEAYRLKAKGHRPYLIVIIDGQLSTDKYSNAFGSHNASEGLATFTTHDQGQFVADLVRYIRYYLVRYALSFVGPTLRNHEDTRGCFFDRKEYKPDIQSSLKTGGLCDQHRAELLPSLTPESKHALDTLCQRVAEDLPYALVLKGGGVKGLALVGAIEVLAEHVSFDVFAGTSAGAIAAVLLAAGYTPAELRAALSNLDFNTFRAEGILRRLWNLASTRTLYSGKPIEAWVERQLAAKIQTLPPIRLADIPKSKRVILYSSTKDGLKEFDSRGNRSTWPAGMAVRCSAAIPYYFAGEKIEGAKAFDGGLRENFPMGKFIETNLGKPIIGLYLKAPQKSSWFAISQMIDAVTTGDEPETVRRYADKVVLIDPSPIRTTDFSLANEDKDFLLAAGRVAALRYLSKYLPDSVTDPGVLVRAEEENTRLQASARMRWGRDES